MIELVSDRNQHIRKKLPQIYQNIFLAGLGLFGTSDLCIIPPPAPISSLIVIIIHQFIHLWQMQLLSSWKFYNQSSNEMFRASIWIYNYWIKSLNLEKQLTAQMISRIDWLENIMFFWQKLAAVAILDCLEFFKYLRIMLIVETSSSCWVPWRLPPSSPASPRPP